MKRGEKKNSDSIGLYITETMPRCIRNFSMELGTQSSGPIVSSIEGTPNRHHLILADDFQLSKSPIVGKLNTILLNKYDQ